jgi:ribosome-binding protein aMBF1 (putative translation factor)
MPPPRLPFTDNSLADTCLWPGARAAVNVAGVPVRTSTNTQLGRAVRRLRHRRGLTIEELASAAEMHTTYLSGIERGLRNPTWSKLCDLAEALSIPVTHLALCIEYESQQNEPARSRSTGASGKG